MMSIFTKLEKKYNWKLKEAPVCLNGGFMHKMYKKWRKVLYGL